jgi:hypothetical protein
MMTWGQYNISEKCCAYPDCWRVKQRDSRLLNELVFGVGVDVHPRFNIAPNHAAPDDPHRIGSRRIR